MIMIAWVVEMIIVIGVLVKIVKAVLAIVDVMLEKLVLEERVYLLPEE